MTKKAGRRMGRSGRFVRRHMEMHSNFTDEEFQFMKFMESSMRREHCPFPTFADVLRWAHELGYRRVDDPEK